MTTLSAYKLVNTDEPEFDEWIEAQEFDYRRKESEVIDYINEVLNYKPVQRSSEQVESIEDLDKMLKACGIEENSQRGEAVKKHIRAYAAHRSG